MFTYWATLVLGPRLLMDPATSHGLRRSFVRFFVMSSSAYLLVAALVPRDRGGIFFGFIVLALSRNGLLLVSAD